MKRNKDVILLLLLCMGIVGGLLLPRWMNENAGIRMELLSASSFQKYSDLELNYKNLLGKIMFSRVSLFLILYFSGYSAAGFWMLSMVMFVLGVSAGFLGVLSVLELGYNGVLFWCCALFPQWLFYGWAGRWLVRFMERRRKRTEFCKVNVPPAFDGRAMAEFLKMLCMISIGILGEAYWNPRILQFFLRIYGNRR